MGIAAVAPLSAGSALNILLTPRSGQGYWRLLRRTADAFTGPNDTGAVVVADRYTAQAVLDFSGLTDGATYFYHLYSTTDNGTTWTDEGPSVSGVPGPSYEDASADPQEVLAERLRYGLAYELAQGNITAPSGTIPVFTAPFALADKISFPCVSVHLENTAPATRYLGEQPDGDFLDMSGDVVDTEGWLASFDITVMGATLNPDERIALRKAIRRVIQANLPVFTAAGMIEIGFSQSDTEKFENLNAPLYFTAGRFTCQAPASIADSVAPVTGVSFSATIGTDTVNV